MRILVALMLLCSVSYASTISETALTIFGSRFNQINIHKEASIQDCNIIIEKYPTDPLDRFRYLLWKYCSINAAYRENPVSLDIYLYQKTGLASWLTQRYAKDGGPLGEFFAKYFPDYSLTLDPKISSIILPVKWRLLSPKKILEEASPPFSEIEMNNEIVHIKALKLTPVYNYSIFVPFDQTRTLIDLAYTIFSKVKAYRYKGKLVLSFGSYDTFEEATKRYSYSLAYLDDLILERSKEGDYRSDTIIQVYKHLKKLLKKGKPVQYRPSDVQEIDLMKFTREKPLEQIKEEKKEDLKKSAALRAKELLEKLLKDRKKEAKDSRITLKKAESPISKPRVKDKLPELR